MLHFLPPRSNLPCTGADLGGGCRGCPARPPPPPKRTCGFLIQLVLCKKKICGLLVLKYSKRRVSPLLKKSWICPCCIKSDCWVCRDACVAAKQVCPGPVKRVTCTDFVEKSRTTLYYLQQLFATCNICCKTVFNRRV